MKIQNNFLAFHWLLVACFCQLLLTSCKKDQLPLSLKSKPVSRAGPDQFLNFPTDSTRLDGSLSTDADGSIVSYRWKKISGPDTFLIVQPAGSNTSLLKLVRGVFQFELSVTDNDGLIGLDTVKVIVKVPGTILNVQLVPIGNLSMARKGIAVATASNKIFFAGGFNESPTLSFSKRIDVYDIIAGSWSTFELNKARAHIAAVAVGNKILIAGGASDFDFFNWSWQDLSSRVDIYDISTNRWTTTELPEAMYFNFGEGSCEVSGNNAYFFGGTAHDSVYIYDAVAGSWTTKTVGITRDVLFTTSAVDNKILVGANKWPDRRAVDIYNTISQTWTQSNLSEGRDYIRTGSLNSKAFFAGGKIGTGFSSNVDIYNTASHTWDISNLSQATVLAGIAGVGQSMLFFGGTRVDIYNTLLNTWEALEISESFASYSSFITSGNNIYATKGNTVWRVQF